MRILVLHNYYQLPGGEDTVFRAETALLGQHGHQVQRFVMTNQGLTANNRFRTAIETIWSWPAQKNLKKVIEDFQPSVVHFHNTFLRISPAAYYTCQSAGIPVVQTLHNYRLLCPAATFTRDGRICQECLDKAFLWPAVKHKCWRGSRASTAVVAAMLAMHRQIKTWQNRVDIYIALTEFSRQKFIQGGFAAQKIVVKPNFVSIDPGQGDSDGSFALFAGRISPEKGLLTLIKACQHLPDIPLRIIGDGPQAIDLKEKTAHDGLTQVDWCGAKTRDEVLGSIREARFIVFPSEWYETFGMVIIESFACAKPVIASRLGAMAELVEEGKTGLLFEPGNAEDLAAKMRWAWEHKAEMQQMGENARCVYEAKYTPEKNYQMLMAIYEKAIENHRAL